MQKLIDHQEFGGMLMAFQLEGAATEETRNPRVPQHLGCEGLVQQPVLSPEMARKQKENHRWTVKRFTCWQKLPFYPFHLEQDYKKRLFTALEGKLAGATIMTKLNAL